MNTRRNIITRMSAKSTAAASDSVSSTSSPREEEAGTDCCGTGSMDAQEGSQHSPSSGDEDEEVDVEVVNVEGVSIYNIPTRPFEGDMGVDDGGEGEEEAAEQEGRRKESHAQRVLEEEEMQASRDREEVRAAYHGLQVKNIKLSVKVPPTHLDDVVKKCIEKNINYKVHPNFVVIYDQCTINLFKRSARNPYAEQHANITRIPSFRDMKRAVAILSFYVQSDARKLFPIVDNITAKAHVGFPVNLDEFVEKNADIGWRMHMNREAFPGLFIRSQVGTLIMFRTGVLVSIGSKNLRDIEWHIGQVRKRCALLRYDNNEE